MKTQELAEKAERVFGDVVNITTEGKRHLGAIIGSKDYKNQYYNENVPGWKEEITTLADTAQSQPHAAYIAFTKGYQSKFAYFMRTIESFEEYVSPIQEAINHMRLPPLFSQTEPLPDELSELVTLTPAQGGMGIPNLRVEASQQYAASKSITKQHVESIRTQSAFMATSEQSVENHTRNQQSLNTETTRLRMDQIDASLPPDLLRLIKQARDKGASSWLNAIPLEEQDLALNKQEFRDSVRMFYNMPLSDLPCQCACGDRFSIDHALLCKKKGFVAQRHDGIRDLLTTTTTTTTTFILFLYETVYSI